MKRTRADGKKQIKRLRNNKTDYNFLPELAEFEDDFLQTQNLSAALTPATTDAGEELPLEQTMTADEINDHILKCLEMSTENKITPKNAFALQLIDCLKYLADKKEDFSTMACSLDAGAKIYSYRVDALHQKVTTLADEMTMNLRNNQTTDEAEDGVPHTSGGRFTRKLKGILTTNDSIVRKLKREDPKDKYLKVTALPGAIISGVALDQKDLSFTLEKNIPFWPDYTNYKPTRAEGCVTLPKIEVVRDSTRVACFESISLLQSHVSHRRESEKEVPFPETICDSEPVVNQFSETDHEINNLPEDTAQSQASNTIDLVEDDTSDHERTGNDKEGEVEVLATAMRRLNEEAQDGICPPPTRAEAIKMLFDSNSEYHYLDMKNAKYWAGPDYWTRHRQGSSSAENNRGKQRKKKEPASIEYDFEDLEVNWDKGFRSGSKFVCKQMKSWKPPRVTTPKDLRYDLNTFKDLFHMYLKRTMEKEKNDKSEGDPSGTQSSAEFFDVQSGGSNSPENEDEDDKRGLLNSIYHQDDDVCEEHSASSRDEVDAGDYPSDIPSPNIEINGRGRLIKINVDSDNTPGYDGASLVPAPKLVHVKPIQFKSRPIRVDMGHLKEVMLDQIKKDFEKDQRGQTTFSKLLREIPPRLEKTTAQDLTPSLAYMALLTLANENNFHIKSCDNYKDATVTLMEDVNCNRIDENNSLDHHIINMVNDLSKPVDE